MLVVISKCLIVWEYVDVDFGIYKFKLIRSYLDKVNLLESGITLLLVMLGKRGWLNERKLKNLNRGSRVFR